MLKTSSRVALGFLALYACGILAFAFLHYGGDRPSAGTVLSDFHGWLGIGSSDPTPPLPPAQPPEEPTPPAPETPQGPVAEPPTIAPAPDAVPETTQADLDTVEKLLGEAEAAAKELRREERGPEFEGKVRGILGKLGEAREILNRVLDTGPKSPRGNKLWDRLQKLHNAVKHM